MKTIIRTYLINVFALWATTILIDGFSLSGGVQTLLLVAVGITVTNSFVKPILSIIFLPLNVITLGTSMLLVNALLLYGLTYIFPQIMINRWHFAGYAYNGFTIPEITFDIIPTYILTGFMLSIIAGILRWLE